MPDTLAAGPKIVRAQALRRSMATMITKGEPRIAGVWTEPHAKRCDQLGIRHQIPVRAFDHA